MLTIPLPIQAFGRDGFCITYFPTEEHNRARKSVLGWIFEPQLRRWISLGPQVLEDMMRFGIPFQPVDAEAALRIENYKAKMNAIAGVQFDMIGSGEYGYQIPGTNLLQITGRAILADQMGLGKSKQTLDAARNMGALRTLVVCPKSLIFNWEREVNKWFPDAEPVVVMGTRYSQEIERWLMAEKPVVFITNYEKVIQANAWYHLTNWHVLIFDEAQRVKNKLSQTHKRLRDIADMSVCAYALTGTPIEKNLDEFHGIASVVLPALFGGYGGFADQHVEVNPDTGAIIGEKNRDLLQDRIRPWIIRRTKEQVLHQLPPKVYTEAVVMMTQAETTAYKYILRQFTDWVKTYTPGKSAELFAQMLRLQQFTSSPELRMPGAGSGSKFSELCTILNGWPGRALVFSRFKEMAELMVKWLRIDPRASITGSTKSENRLTIIDDFNAGKLGSVLVCTDAAAFGLNISADLVVHYDKLWNPAKEEQREDRCHGVGRGIAGKKTNVVHLLTDGTIDMAMHAVTQRRARLASRILDGKDEQNAIARLSAGELIRMVSGKDHQLDGSNVA